MRPGGAEWPCIASGRVSNEGSKYSGAIRLNNISGARMTPHGRSEMAPCYGTLYIWFAGFQTADSKRYSRNSKGRSKDGGILLWGSVDLARFCYGYF